MNKTNIIKDDPFCILDFSGEYIVQKWPLFIQTTKAFHSLWHLPHFQIPLLQRSQRLPVIVSTCANTYHTLKLLELYLENMHTKSVCKHTKVPGPAEEFPDG